MQAGSILDIAWTSDGTQFAGTTYILFIIIDFTSFHMYFLLSELSFKFKFRMNKKENQQEKKNISMVFTVTKTIKNSVLN